MLKVVFCVVCAVQVVRGDNPELRVISVDVLASDPKTCTPDMMRSAIYDTDLALAYGVQLPCTHNIVVERDDTSVFDRFTSGYVDEAFRFLEIRVNRSLADSVTFSLQSCAWDAEYFDLSKFSCIRNSECSGSFWTRLPHNKWSESTCVLVMVPILLICAIFCVTVFVIHFVFLRLK